MSVKRLINADQRAKLRNGLDDIKNLRKKDKKDLTDVDIRKLVILMAQKLGILK